MPDTIDSCNCSQCGTLLWYNLGNISDETQAESEGLECFGCGHICPHEPLTIEDYGYDSMEEFIESADILDTFRTPDEARALVAATPTLNSYYILMDHYPLSIKDEVGNIKSGPEHHSCWAITRTLHDLDSEVGLIAWIREEESHRGGSLLLRFWKRLRANPDQDLKLPEGMVEKKI